MVWLEYYYQVFIWLVGVCCFNGGVYFCWVVIVIIDQYCVVWFVVDFGQWKFVKKIKVVFCFLEVFQCVQNSLIVNFFFCCYGDGCCCVQCVMVFWGIECYLQDCFILVYQVEMFLCFNLMIVFDVYVGVVVKIIGGDLLVNVWQ